jgi:CheY-like chemotaxis protein
VQSTSVPGGQEAIEAFKAFEGSSSTAKGFDIILMDLSMPEVSGFDATSAIRQMEKASDYGHRAYIVAIMGCSCQACLHLDAVAKDDGSLWYDCTGE